MVTTTTTQQASGSLASYWQPVRDTGWSLYLYLDTRWSLYLYLDTRWPLYLYLDFSDEHLSQIPDNREQCTNWHWKRRRQGEERKYRSFVWGDQRRVLFLGKAIKDIFNWKSFPWMSILYLCYWQAIKVYDTRSRRRPRAPNVSPEKIFMRMIFLSLIHISEPTRPY